MRYAKGGLVINPERDIPLLRQVRNSRVADMEIDGGDMVISGVKTIQVEVKQ